MQKKTKEKLVLLDAHAIIHRAYHAIPDFATSLGKPTGALYGLVLMILKIAIDLKPDYIVACYDLPKPTYRHEVYEGYKAGRVKTDNDLVEQLEESKQICEVLNIPIYSKEGFEADDMLGTIVEKLKIENSKLKTPIDIIIASGDMDTMQLVRDGGKNEGSVKVYTLKKGIKETILYDEEAVFDRFGFAPEFLVDFKGLRGDPSDNIIGIPGIGEKSATELIKNFGTIENIYKVLKKDPKKLEEKGIKKRIIELLKEGEEEAKFSKMLATIRRDAPIDFVIPSKKWKNGLDLKVAEKLFTKLEFRNMGAKLKQVIGDSQNNSLEQPGYFSTEKSPHSPASRGPRVALEKSFLDYPGQIADFINEAEKNIKAGGRVIATTLTKKMAEDLSEYLKEKGIKAEYLHSDIKTIERIEILTRLRKGPKAGGFDCLIGVNLLREGLDLPEVTLIGILDADKEGFLRSDTSLIQIIGRAARNVKGKVILYADRMTGSMERAIEETSRRRQKQIAYNKKHKITPKTIIKKIQDITDQLRSEHSKAVDELTKIDLGGIDPSTSSGRAKITKLIRSKEKQMEASVKILDFETAALLRDEILELEKLNTTSKIKKFKNPKNT